jgi:preprotein translocase subunit YajC
MFSNLPYVLIYLFIFAIVASIQYYIFFLSIKKKMEKEHLELMEKIRNNKF